MFCIMVVVGVHMCIVTVAHVGLHVQVLYCDSRTRATSSKSPALTLLEMLLCLSKASHLSQYDLKFDGKFFE